MMTIWMLATLLAVAPAGERMPADSALAALGKGGYTILWRHTSTDWSVTESREAPSPERFRQRNLNDRGVKEARDAGKVLARRGIPIGDVIASPMFRTRETAEYAFGRTTTDSLLRALKPSSQQRRLLATAPAPGTNRVLVTHHFVIENHAPGIRPGDVNEGEAVVVRADGDSLRTIAVIKMSDWTRWREQDLAATPEPPPAASAGHGAAGPQAIPQDVVTLLRQPAHAAIGKYLHAFNSGDPARMREVLQSSVVPNPERPIEQRLEQYDRLKRDLGVLTPLSAQSSEPHHVEVRVQGSTGPSATVAFVVEPAAPHRITSIRFMMGHH
jgi:phosphohistidine phosphatase SixA